MTTAPHSSQLTAAAPPHDVPAATRDHLGVARVRTSARVLARSVDVARTVHGGVARRRRGLLLIATLAVIAILSSVTAWMLWEATVERRVLVGGDAAELRDETTLLKEPPERRTSIDSTTARRGGAAQPADEAPRAAVEQPSAIPGPALAAASAGAALVAGGIAGTVVIRRYRRPRDAQEAPEAAWTADPDRAADDDQVAARRDPVSHRDEEDSRPEQTAGQLGLETEFDHLTPAVHLREAPAEGSVGSGQVEPASRRAGAGVAGTGHQPTAVAGSRVQEAGQRVFENRKAPRIPFDGPGQLQWRAGASEVSILDLSEIGLRCRFPAAVTPGTAPKAPQTVVLAFAVEGRLVDVTGRVAWRKTTSEGIDVGLEFTAMSDDDRQLLRHTCAAASE